MQGQISSFNPRDFFFFFNLLSFGIEMKVNFKRPVLIPILKTNLRYLN